MLDKPLGLTLEAARRLAAAVDDAGVVTQLMLTHRYRAERRRSWSKPATIAVGAARVRRRGADRPLPATRCTRGLVLQQRIVWALRALG